MDGEAQGWSTSSPMVMPKACAILKVTANVGLALPRSIWLSIERLTPEDYENLSYYERWAKSLAWVLVDKGVVSEAELAERAEAIRARQEAEA